MESGIRIEIESTETMLTSNLEGPAVEAPFGMVAGGSSPASMCEIDYRHFQRQA